MPTATAIGQPLYGLDDLAWQTDKGIVPAGALVGNLCRQSILLPSAEVIERIV